MASHRSSKEPAITGLLKKILQRPLSSKPLTFGDLIKLFGHRGYGIIIILFALPSALPISVVPGFSFIFGLPIVFVALHLIIGKAELWLPAKLSRKKTSQKNLVQVIKKTLPYLQHVEQFVKPRFDFFSSNTMERCHGLVLLILSLLLLLPIPLSNFIFASLIICFGFGMIERDGIFLGVAYIGSLAYISFLIVISQKIIVALF